MKINLIKTGWLLVIGMLIFDVLIVLWMPDSYVAWQKIGCFLTLCAPIALLVYGLIQLEKNEKKFKI